MFNILAAVILAAIILALALYVLAIYTEIKTKGKYRPGITAISVAVLILVYVGNIAVKEFSAAIKILQEAESNYFDKADISDRVATTHNLAPAFMYNGQKTEHLSYRERLEALIDEQTAADPRSNDVSKKLPEVLNEKWS